MNEHMNELYEFEHYMIPNVHKIIPIHKFMLYTLVANVQLRL